MKSEAELVGIALDALKLECRNELWRRQRVTSNKGRRLNPHEIFSDARSIVHEREDKLFLWHQHRSLYRFPVVRDFLYSCNSEHFFKYTLIEHVILQLNQLLEQMARLSSLGVERFQQLFKFTIFLNKLFSQQLNCPLLLFQGGILVGELFW